MLLLSKYIMLVSINNPVTDLRIQIIQFMSSLLYDLLNFYLLLAIPVIIPSGPIMQEGLANLT